MTGFGKIITALIIIIILGAGYMAFALDTESLEGEHAHESAEEHAAHADEEMDHHDHDHGDLEAIEAEGPMSLEIEVTADPKEGWNVHLMPEGFTFAPENASGEHVDGEGHAHIYVDDVKVGRVYGEWYHLKTLSEGEHEIEVTLNSNAHNDYAVDGQVVSATKTVVE